MSIHSDKLAHIQVIINCRYSVAQICTREDKLAHYLGAPFIDDVMRYNILITISTKKQTKLHLMSDFSCFAKDYYSHFKRLSVHLASNHSFRAF